MDGITGVMSRIAEIEARIRSFQPAAPVTSAPSVQSNASRTALGTDAFGTVLSQSLATSAARNLGITSSASATGATSSISGLSGLSGTSVSGTSRLRTSDGVPLELVKYGNGKVPATALSGIGQGQHKLWAPAAQAYTGMRAAAARDGVTIKATDSFRSYDQQVDVARRKGLYSQGGLAAKPGTSEHGWGLSLDLDLDTKALTWMRVHAKEYGFEENAPREPWHWTFTA